MSLISPHYALSRLLDSTEFSRHVFSFGEEQDFRPESGTADFEERASQGA
jgi:hypothetical protein